MAPYVSIAPPPPHYPDSLSVKFPVNALECEEHGPNNYKDTKLVFKRVYRLEIQSAMLVFSTPLVN